MINGNNSGGIFHAAKVYDVSANNHTQCANTNFPKIQCIMNLSGQPTTLSVTTNAMIKPDETNKCIHMYEVRTNRPLNIPEENAARAHILQVMSTFHSNAS